MRESPLRTTTLPHWLPKLAPWVAAILILAAGLSFFGQREHFRRTELEFHATADAARHGALIERQIDQLKLLTSLLAFDIRAGNAAFFAAETVELALGTPLGKFEFSLITQGTTHTVQIGSAPSRAMLDLLPQPNGPEQVSPLGPLNVFADEAGIAAEQALYVVSSNGGGRHWGLLRGRMPWDRIEADAAMARLIHRTYAFHLVSPRTDNSAGKILRKSQEHLENPVIHPLETRSKLALQLEIAPRNGWPDNFFFYAELALVAVAAMFSGIVVKLLMLRAKARQ